MKHRLTALIEAIAQEEALLARLDEERQVVSERVRMNGFRAMGFCRRIA